MEDLLDIENAEEKPSSDVAMYSNFQPQQLDKTGMQDVQFTSVEGPHRMFLRKLTDDNIKFCKKIEELQVFGKEYEKSSTAYIPMFPEEVVLVKDGGKKVFTQVSKFHRPLILNGDKKLVKSLI